MAAVAGSGFGALMLIVGALILITRAGASPEEKRVLPTTSSEVIYAAEPVEDDSARRLAAAAAAPTRARAMLDELGPSVAVARPFDPDGWEIDDSGCTGTRAQVLETRSLSPADTDGDACAAQGLWVDRELGTRVTRADDVAVVLFVPPAVAHDSGGWRWTPETRAGYVADLDHPATLQVFAAGAGHNPRGQDPADWRPADRSTWCAYAVDWIAVKHRWGLTVTAPERAALGTMLDSCADGASAGADPLTAVVDEPVPPPIELASG